MPSTENMQEVMIDSSRTESTLFVARGQSFQHDLACLEAHVHILLSCHISKIGISPIVSGNPRRRADLRTSS